VSPANPNSGKTGVAEARQASQYLPARCRPVRIQELAVYLANEGLRVSDSQVIKAALPLALSRTSGC